MNASKPYEKIVFPNGVRLLLIPKNDVGSVASSVMVGVGSRHETRAINGVSHFLEHMVFKGTKKYPTTEDVNFIERIGGLQNAYTDIDITNYHNKVLASDWKSGLEINKELALYPRLEQKHIDKERDVILEEMKRYEDEPAGKVGEVFHQMLYPATKLGMRVIGEVDSMKAASAETLRSYHNQWYRPERIVVVAAGNVKDEEVRIKNQIEEWFGSIPSKSNGKIEKMEHVKDMQKEPAVAIVTKPDAQQAHLTLGVRTFARTNSDRFAWNVFNLLFGVGFTSRLFKEIREKKGLCYAIRSSSDTFDDVGYWSIYAGVATAKVDEAIAGIIAEMKKVLESGVKDEEVEVAKKRLQTMVTFRSEDPEYLNEWYGRQEVYGMPILSIEEYIAEIERVSKENVDRLIAKYFTQKTINLALVWNKPMDNNLLKLLSL